MITGTGNKAEWTHCVHGHEFTPANTFFHATTGTRQCKACRRRYNTAYVRRQRLRRRDLGPPLLEGILPPACHVDDLRPSPPLAVDKDAGPLPIDI